MDTVIRKMAMIEKNLDFEKLFILFSDALIASRGKPQQDYLISNSNLF